MKLVLETAAGFETLGNADGRPFVGGNADGQPLVGVLPGDDIALHHVPGSADEARLQAIDLAARPMEELHIAIGPADGDGCWLAIIDRAALRAHLARFAAAGLEPTHLLPAALLLPPATDGPVTAALGDQVLLRTERLAACVEPGLLPALGVAAGTPPPFRPHLADVLLANALPLDLLQGAFAPRRRWWRERAFQLPALAMLLLLVAALAAPPLLQASRNRAAIAAADRQTVELARATLGGEPQSAAAAAAALADAREAAEGHALAPRLAFVAEGVANTPGAALERLQLQADGGIDLVAAGGAEAINQLGQFLATGPFRVGLDGPRLQLGGRRPPPTPQTAVFAATLRLAAARQDVALLQGQATAPLPPAVAAARLAAGLDGSSIETLADGSVRVVVPAARAAVLLPLVAGLEQQGAGIRTALVERNDDRTVHATLEFQ